MREFLKNEIIFDYLTPCTYHPNTLDIYAYNGEELLGNHRFYSVGGGSIEIEGEGKHVEENIYPFKTFNDTEKYLKENNITPNNNLTFIFSTYEEVGHGASNIPNIDELVAVDMGCIGLDLSCNEEMVSICAKDSSGPYDYNMTTELINLAKANNLNYAVDISPFYGSDGSAALRAGNDIKCALIGSGIQASHGMERTHLNGILNTFKLIIAYINK